MPATQYTSSLRGFCFTWMILLPCITKQYHPAKASIQPVCLDLNYMGASEQLNFLRSLKQHPIKELQGSGSLHLNLLLQKMFQSF